MRFGEFRKYVSKIDRVSICMEDTLQYENFQFISEVPESYDDYYLYGIGRIISEFTIRQARDVAYEVYAGQVPREEDLDKMIMAECIEIMLSKTPRDFEKEAAETEE